MTFEDENKCVDDSSEPTNQSSEQRLNVHDLTSSMSTTDDTTTQESTTSQQNSPSKQPANSSEPNTPSKSSTRNRRRKEARQGRNQKAKQQQSTECSNKTNPNNQSEKQNNKESILSEATIPTAEAGSSRGDHSNIPTLDTEQICGQQDGPAAEPSAKIKSGSSPDSRTLDQTQTDGSNGCNKATNKSANDPISWRMAQHDNMKREIRQLSEHLRARDFKLNDLLDKLRLQGNRVKELETTLLSTTKTCNQFEKLLQHELVTRSRLENENGSLNQTVARLKAQINIHETNKSSSDELIRALNATLMERETEISILKLKMTRMQTNAASTKALNLDSTSAKDPCLAYTATGRSNSEFCRNSYLRSSMLAEVASAKGSTSHLKGTDRDATVWAKVPEELTPSRRPLLLDKSLQPLYNPPLSNHYDRLPSPGIGDPNSTPILRNNRQYRTMPRSMRSPSYSNEKRVEADSPYMQPTSSLGLSDTPSNSAQLPTTCRVTNLDDTSSTNQSGTDSKAVDTSGATECSSPSPNARTSQNQNGPMLGQGDQGSLKVLVGHDVGEKAAEASHYSTIGQVESSSSKSMSRPNADYATPLSLPQRAPTTPIKLSGSLKKIFGKFRRSESNANSTSNSKTDIATPTVTPVPSPFKRGANRSTMVANPSDIRSQISTRRNMNIQTDKPFAEWDTDMLADWLTMIGLSMYAQNCKRWVKCGAHIMNATPAEVDKGLGITNHIHRKKLRLAISELNGDSDKVTKAASKLDYLWVARWLEDIGLPQHKEAFINARVDGRVLNYLTVEDLVSMNVKSLLHHASIRCGVKVLRSINFDLQQLKRRATAEESERMESVRQQMNQVSGTPNSRSFKQPTDNDVAIDTDVPLWTCHRVMEWLRMIDFAEFAPNLRGSGVHGGLLILEDGFNIDTMCSLLSIPSSKTLLRRHLSTFFEGLIGEDLVQRKRQHKELPSSQQINTSAEMKTPKKSPLWFSKLKSSKVAQDGAMDEYICPMYSVEPLLMRNSKVGRRSESAAVSREGSQLSRIPESINV